MPSRRLLAIYALAGLAVALTGCTHLAPATSSNAVLSPERTWVIVAKPVRPAAGDVVRLFRDRGFQLAGLDGNESGLALRFKGERKWVAEQVVTAGDALVAVSNALETYDAVKDKREPRLIYNEPTIETYELGSVFHVRVEPRGTTMTSIAIVGRPTRDGIEACTADPELTAPCAPLRSGPRVHDEIAGYAEAELITSVFAELRLEGNVVAPDVQRTEAYAHCLQRRRAIAMRAAQVSDARARIAIGRTAPSCEVDDSQARGIAAR